VATVRERLREHDEVAAAPLAEFERDVADRLERGAAVARPPQRTAAASAWGAATPPSPKEDEIVVRPAHREVHFWAQGTTQPPCGTVEDRFEWSDAVEDVSCETCLEALAGDGGDLAPRTSVAEGSAHPSP
jgi:hypothetical protein